jgi:hypothetical protein
LALIYTLDLIKNTMAILKFSSRSTKNAGNVDEANKNAAASRKQEQMKAKKEVNAEDLQEYDLVDAGDGNVIVSVLMRRM